MQEVCILLPQKCRLKSSSPPRHLAPSRTGAWGFIGHPWLLLDLSFLLQATTSLPFAPSLISYVTPHRGIPLDSPVLSKEMQGSPGSAQGTLLFAEKTALKDTTKENFPATPYTCVQITFWKRAAGWEDVNTGEAWSPGTPSQSCSSSGC